MNHPNQQLTERLTKLESYSARLLDLFRQLQEKYALFEPMLLDRETVEHFGKGDRARGFLVLRDALFLSCAQDMATLTFDRHSTVPSIMNVMAALERSDVVEALRTNFAVSPPVTVVSDVATGNDIADEHARVAPGDRMSRATVADLIAATQTRYAEQQLAAFGKHVGGLRDKWDKLRMSPIVESCRIVRDKISAHTELRYEGDRYVPVELKTLGLTARDFSATLELMREVVALIGTVVRASDFAWDAAAEHYTRSSQAFWSTSSASAL